MTEWEFKGRELVNCTCEYGCNCQFNALPDKGHCSAVAGIQIDEGHHGDTRLDAYRGDDVPPTRIVGLLARWCGVVPDRRELTAAEFCARLIPSTIPARPVVFTEEDDRWLRNG